jgi:hypothetical protein
VVHERISRVVEGAFADHTKALTGRTTEYNVHGTIADAGMGAYVLAVYVGDASTNRGAVGEVKFVGRTMDGVVFHSRGHIESGLLEAETHSTGTGKQIDTYRPSCVCAHSENFFSANIMV